MAVLIKDMEMPRDCPMCPVAHWNKQDKLTGCELVNRYVPMGDRKYWDSDARPDWCPLIEVNLPKSDPDADELLVESNFEL